MISIRRKRENLRKGLKDLKTTKIVVISVVSQDCKAKETIKSLKVSNEENENLIRMLEIKDTALIPKGGRKQRIGV
jgi:hypothetical protein